MPAPLQNIDGIFQPAGCARTCLARIRRFDTGELRLTIAEDPSLNRNVSPAAYQVGSKLAGLPQELRFNDGAIFIPDDKDLCWSMSPRQRLLTCAENKIWLVLLATVACIVSSVWLVTYGLPTLASRCATQIPAPMVSEIGQEVFMILEKTTLQHSTLPAAQQQSIQEQWQHTLQQLGLPIHHYSLYFRDSQLMGANALALPNGTIIVTDELVRLLEQQPQSLTAVLLHELGHVEQRHALKVMAQSMATTLFFAFYFGDIDSIGDLVIGGSSALLQNRFSREMEGEADLFALTHLQYLGIPATAFADALRALQQAHRDDSRSMDASDAHLSQYLSTHPDITSRIRFAENIERRSRQPLKSP